MRNQALLNEIERRTKEMEKYNFENARRMATINLLEEIASSVDFYQKQVQHAFKSIGWYNQQFGMRATTLQRYDNWQIKKATLTRLQDRYKKTMEILIRIK
jgi:hypothetical protein